jgi:gluconate kinase
MDNFLGVYSSLKAVHRDALRFSNRGLSDVYLFYDDQRIKPSLTMLRNVFKGKQNYEVKYKSSASSVRIYKTRLKD